VDGFNLYYGAVRRTPYKWLDLHALCTFLLPQNEIQKIDPVGGACGKSVPFDPPG